MDIDFCGGRSHAAALYEKHEQLEMESSPCTPGLEALEGTYKGHTSVSLL